MVRIIAQAISKHLDDNVLMAVALLDNTLPEDDGDLNLKESTACNLYGIQT